LTNTKEEESEAVAEIAVDIISAAERK